MDHFPWARLRDAVIAKRRLLVTLLLVGGLVGAVAGALRPRWYAADVTLAVRRAAALDDTNAPPDSADYPTLLANRVVAQDIVEKHQLGRWRIDATRLLELVSIREVRNTTLLVLSVTLPEPDLARQVANSFSTRATELNRDLNARDVIRARDMIKAQLDEARTALREAEARLLEHRTTALVEMRRADSKSKLDARGELVDLSANLQAERNRLAMLEKQRTLAPETTPGGRQPAAEQELAEQARQFERMTSPRPTEPETAAEAGDRMGREIPAWPRGESGVNPVRQLLEYQVSASRARVAALEGRIGDLTGRHNVDDKVLPDLVSLYEGEVQLTRFELEREIAARAVTDLSAQYEQARLKVASRVTDLQVVDEAVTPNRPVTSGVAVTAVIGLLLGLVGCVLVFVPVVVRALMVDEPGM